MRSLLVVALATGLVLATAACSFPSEISAATECPGATIERVEAALRSDPTLTVARKLPADGESRPRYGFAQFRISGRGAEGEVWFHDDPGTLQVVTGRTRPKSPDEIAARTRLRDDVCALLRREIPEIRSWRTYDLPDPTASVVALGLFSVCFATGVFMGAYEIVRHIGRSRAARPARA